MRLSAGRHERGQVSLVAGSSSRVCSGNIRRANPADTRGDPERRQAFAAILDRYSPSVVFYGGCYDLAFMRAIARDTVKSGRASILMGDSTKADHVRRPWIEYGKRLLLRGAYNGAIVRRNPKPGLLAISGIR